jgi:putative salt-induced outer membrane protein YdiY
LAWHLALALLALSTASAAQGETIKLRNGDRVSGEVVERTDRRLVIEHPVLGRLEVPVEELEPDSSVRPGLFGTQLLRGWVRRFDVGFSGSEGNTVESNVRVGLGMDYEDERHRWHVAGHYLRNTSDDETDDHQAHLQIDKDWRFKNSRWFFGSGGRFDWDRFEDWTYRASLYGAPGYEFFHSDTFQVRGLLGMAVTREFESGRGTSPEGLLAWRLKWVPAEGHAVSAQVAYLPDLDDRGEWRVLSKADYTLTLSQEKGLAFKVGVTEEYDSNSTDAERNDFKYFGSLVFDF